MPRYLLTLLVAATAMLMGATSASANRGLESMLQDDIRLLSENSSVRTKALNEAQSLGVKRLRITVFWYRIAPGFKDQNKPAGFEGSDPASYGNEAWKVYDSLLKGAKARGMDVLFTLSGGAPLWATSGRFDSKVDAVTNPSAAEFWAFVKAVGTRYSGQYTPTGSSEALPRVSQWSIWNEPNQGAWLAPQWSGSGASAVEKSPAIYRELLDAAWVALNDSGHGSDTLLIGETAPKGAKAPLSATNPMQPLRFIRTLYCLDSNSNLLSGSKATERGCPSAPDASKFVADHPGLFKMSGFAHHPYELLLAPTKKPGDPRNEVTTANLATLSRALKIAMSRYGVSRSAIPLYLTEYGYQSNPPDPDAGIITLARQAEWINHGQYIAWRNSNVRTLAQFLLTDDAPVSGPKSSRWRSSFQTGLRFGPGSGRDGKAKPSLAAYRTPIFLPKASLARAGSLGVWGQVRPGSGARRVTIQVRYGSGSWRNAKNLKTNAYGYISTKVNVSKSGSARLFWKSSRGAKYYSRTARFSVR